MDRPWPKYRMKIYCSGNPSPRLWMTKDIFAKNDAGAKEQAQKYYNDLVREFVKQKEPKLDDKTLVEASARSSGSSICSGSQVPALLCSLADQHMVWSRGGTSTDAEQRIERGMPRPATIEAEHELVEVVLEVDLPQSVIDAQPPALEV